MFSRICSSVALVSNLLTPATARADVALDWNAIAVNTAIGAGQNPFSQARFAAIAQLAVFEAVNAITGDYEPYLGTITAPPGASAEAAAAAAAHRVLVNYFGSNMTTLNTLNAALATSLASIPDGQAETDGIDVGVAAANAMIANRANDGSAPPQLYVPQAAAPGVWQPTPGCPTDPVSGAPRGALLHWRNVTPFGIERALDFLAEPPPALDSRRYRKDLLEVMTVGAMNASSADRPQDRADVARFYAASSPTYLFNLAARQIAFEQGRSLSENARALALINMAINDALVASFATKYHYDFWRPINAIHAAGNSGFTPYILTPCFPSYPSNHASGSVAGAEMLRRLYGAGGHDITLENAATPGISLHYTKLQDITADVDDARVYSGIHFRFDQVAGNQLGRAVATEVYKSNLRKAKGAD